MKSILPVSWALNQRAVVVVCLLFLIQTVSNVWKKKCLVRVAVYSLSLQLDQKNGFPIKTTEHLLYKKWSYIQAFIKWLKVEVVLFCKSQMQLLEWKEHPTDADDCSVYVFSVRNSWSLMWYFCVVGEKRLCGCQCFTKELQLCILCLNFYQMHLSLSCIIIENTELLSSVCFQAKNRRIVATFDTCCLLWFSWFSPQRPGASDGDVYQSVHHSEISQQLLDEEDHLTCSHSATSRLTFLAFSWHSLTIIECFAIKFGT